MIVTSYIDNSSELAAVLVGEVDRSCVDLVPLVHGEPGAMPLIPHLRARSVDDRHAAGH